MSHIYIISGGTVSYVRRHFALCAPAYGGTGRRLCRLCTQSERLGKRSVRLIETRMAGGKPPDAPETFHDIAVLIKKLVDDPETSMIFMPAAIIDYTGNVEGVPPSAKANRLISRRQRNSLMSLEPLPKQLATIREQRKDIYLVGFKDESGSTEDQLYGRGLELLKSSSCNLVLANDGDSLLNMVITPEEARYHVTTDRMKALAGLVDIALARSQLHFTRSEVEPGDAVPWSSTLIPGTLRTVVNHCIISGAYTAIRGATAGHFACKIDENRFLTSKRKSDFNKLSTVGLVDVTTIDDERVRAIGGKPSVGGQSQRIIFRDHPQYDCIVHFHRELRQDHPDTIPRVSQREVECGSHACGHNTSNGLKRFGNLSAVFLEHHGPNIVFHHSINPQEVIDFIDANFDLSDKTGGSVAYVANYA